MVETFPQNEIFPIAGYNVSLALSGASDFTLSIRSGTAGQISNETEIGAIAQLIADGFRNNFGYKMAKTDGSYTATKDKNIESNGRATSFSVQTMLRALGQYKTVDQLPKINEEKQPVFTKKVKSKAPLTEVIEQIKEPDPDLGKNAIEPIQVDVKIILRSLIRLLKEKKILPKEYRLEKDLNARGPILKGVTDLVSEILIEAMQNEGIIPAGALTRDQKLDLIEQCEKLSINTKITPDQLSR